MNKDNTGAPWEPAEGLETYQDKTPVQFFTAEELEDDKGRDPFWDKLSALGKQNHATRVAKTPERVRNAVSLFIANGIEFELKNAEIGHFHCRRKSDDKLFQFWAGTGKILGSEQRGIHAMINILLGKGS